MSVIGGEKNPGMYLKSILIDIKLSMITEVWIPIVKEQGAEPSSCDKKFKID